MTGFWKHWLTIWCWAVGLFGLVLALGAFEATAAPIAWFYGLVGGGAPPEFTPALRFATGLMGALTIGWALTLAAAIRAAQAGATGLWRGIGGAVLAWYVIDSALSVATGFALNAVSNTVLLIGLMLPLWRGGVLAARPATAHG